MVEQRKLARFVGGLENDSTKSERIGKAIGVAAVEVPCPIKEPDLIRTLSGLHHKLKGTRVQPPLPLLDQLGHGRIRKRPGMLFAQLELDIESPRFRHLHDVLGFQGHVCESLATFDPRNANVRAEIEVGRKLTLRHCHFERASARHSRHTVPFCGGNLSPRSCLVGYHPAGHRDLQN